MKQTVLVADDDLRLLRAMEARLSHEGYRVLSCQDGYQAIAIAHHEHPDLIILDINMPAGSGFSVHERMRTGEDTRSIPVLYITGHDTQVVYDIADRMGAMAVLQKPFGLDDLGRAVHACLTHAREEKASDPEVGYPVA